MQQPEVPGYDLRESVTLTASQSVAVTAAMAEEDASVSARRDLGVPPEVQAHQDPKATKDSPDPRV